MKTKIIQAVVLGLIAAIAIYIRPTRALSLSVVGWGESNSVTSNMIVDGAVTASKVADNATDDNRIVTWDDDNSYDINTTSADNGTLTVDPSISITVPTNKAYYYTIKYEGEFFYLYSERKSSATNFMGNLRVTPMDGTTALTTFYEGVSTGDRYAWATFGNNSYWAMPYSNTWTVRLTEGTHNLKLKLDLYTANLMNYGHTQYQHVQVTRID